MSAGPYRPKSQPLVSAVQWDDNWPEVSQWAYGEVVEANEEDYDSDRYWVLPADTSGIHLSALIDGNENHVDREQWLVKDEFGVVAVWGDDAFMAAYEPARETP